MCKAKINKEIDLDWSEIITLLGLNISSDHLRKTAYGLLEYDNYINGLENTSQVSQRILTISDAHVPFNLPADTFAKYKNKVDVLIFNGDIEDCYSCSQFSKKYRVSVGEEMIATRQYFIDVINLLKPKKAIIVKGNHEVRLGRFLNEKLNDSIMDIMPDSPLELIVNEGFRVKDRKSKTNDWYKPLTKVFKSKCEIVYNGDWYVKVGKTIFVHPLSYSSGMLKTTEKAVNYFLRMDRDFNALVMAHTHRIGSYVQGGIKMYEQGCVCDNGQIDYADGKLFLPSQNGFMYISQDKNGNIIDSKTKIEIIN